MVDNDDGSYVGTYKLLKSGDYNLNVTNENDKLGNSPYTVFFFFFFLKK